jgi:hypothetical protein
MDEMEFTNDLTKLPIEAQYLKWIILLGSQKKNRLIGPPCSDIHGLCFSTSLVFVAPMSDF